MKEKKKEIEKREIPVNVMVDKFVKLIKIMVYIYADFSRKICLVAQSSYRNDSMKKATVRSFYKEIIYHSNGQVYETMWRCVRSGKITKAKWAHNYENIKFRTITYWDVVPFSFTGYESKLTDVIVTPIQNRFRNVSDEVLRAIAYFKNSNRSLSRKIGKLNMYATNNDVCSILWAYVTSQMDNSQFRMTRIPNTKGFKKEFFKNPLRLYDGYQQYKHFYKFLGVDDDNFFWGLYRAGKCHNMATMISEEMFEHMVDISGAAAVVQKIIKADKDILDDTASMYRHLSRFFEAGHFSGLLRGSIREIHDRLIPEYNRIRPMVEYGFEKNYDELREEYRALIRMHASKEAIKAKRDEVIEYLEINANRRIRYSARTLALQSSHEDINFILPKHTGELDDAGQELHNCVASYKHRVMSRDTTIVFMKRGDKRVGCIEVHDGYVRQAYGPCNEPLGGIADEAFNLWVRQHELDGGRFASHNEYGLDDEEEMEW